jgi:hypothetical protein
MSKGKSSRNSGAKDSPAIPRSRQIDSNKHSARYAGPAGDPAWAGTRRSILYAALAVLVSVVFCAQLFRADSMLGGIMGWEVEKLRNDNQTRGQKTWNDLGAEFRTEAAQIQGFSQHEAVSRLLLAVAYVHQGKIEVGRVMGNARTWAAEDKDNLVSRLALAYLMEKSQPVTGGPSQRRFENARKIVDGDKKAGIATMHRDAFNRKWYEIISREIRRADVGVSTAKHIPCEQMAESVALPAITAWLNELSSALRRGNMPENALQCTAWVNESMLGIVESEPDAGARLLAVDLWAKSLNLESQQSAGLRRLRDNFHANADASALDMTDLYNKCPTTQKEFYSESLRNLVLAAKFECAAIGALVFVLFSAVGAGLMRLSNRNAEDHVEAFAPVAPVSIAAVLSFGLLVLTETSVIGRAVNSELGFVVTLFFWFFAGAFWSIAAAGSRQQKPIVVRLFLWTLVLAAIMAPAVLKHEAGLIRTTDLHIRVAVVVGLSLLTLLSAAFVVCHLPASIQLQMSIRAWLLFSICALTALQLHGWYDRKHEKLVAAARWDEFPARLGDNWQTEYLSSLTTSPATTHP